jgi:Kef-type K+ transport system membrane component KefB/nucleotide-binding universal stress UspA family protein
LPLFTLPQFPLTAPTLVFAVLVALVLAAPVLAERVRVPGTVGLVVAGMLIGPGGSGVLSRTGAVSILAELGLLYLVFQVGLGLDLDALRSSRRAGMVVGGLVFVIPMAFGISGALALGYAVSAAVLIGTWWAAHTLMAYPVYERFGVVEDRSVQAAVGGAIVANTAALLVLGTDVRAFQAPLDCMFWAMLVPKLAMLGGLILWALPRVARWFFARMGYDRSVRFLFVLSALFASTAFAELIGVAGIVGAFLAGLALNRLVPSGGVLRERVEFFGCVVLVPIFLISVGMLLDGDVLARSWRPALAGMVFTAVVIVSKGAAVLGAGRLLGFDRAEVGAMFSLSVTQAALTLAGVVVGLDAGVIGLDTVHAVVPVIAVTCLLGTWTANRWAPRLPCPRSQPLDIGESVLVPVSNPDSARSLVRLAAMLVRPESGTVIPLVVVDPEASDEDLENGRKLVARAESMALSQGVEAIGRVRIDGSPSAGVLHAIVEHQATLMLVGWKGYTGAGESIFDSRIDSIVRRSPVPLAVARLVGERFDRILLSIFTGALSLERRPGVWLAIEIARRVAARTSVPISILTDSDDHAVSKLLDGQLNAQVHRDTRRQHVAIGHHARAEDLVIVSVSSTDTGLRTAATRIAWAAPESSIIVALDAGVRRVGALPDRSVSTR